MVVSVFSVELLFWPPTECTVFRGKGHSRKVFHPNKDGCDFEKQKEMNSTESKNNFKTI
jgi:hypothetical protein